MKFLSKIYKTIFELAREKGILETINKFLINTNFYIYTTNE